MLKNASKGIENAKIEEMWRFLLPKTLHEMIFQKGRRNSNQNSHHGNPRWIRYLVDRVVSNKIHRTSDILFSLEVRPKLNLSGPRRPVTEGENVTLTCNIIDGVPKPELIRWLREKTSLDEKNTTMVLRSIKKEQEGTYTCETSNEGGSANDSIKVIVDSKTL